MSEVREALTRELEQRFPEALFKKEYRVCRDPFLFGVFADEMLKKIPDNVKLSVENGFLQFAREEVKPDAYSALAGDALAEYTKDQGPKDLDSFISAGLQNSSLRHFLQ